MNPYTINYDSVMNREEVKLSPEKVNKVIGMPKVVSEMKNGRIVKSVVFEETPIEKMNEGLTVDDFALEVLLENGYNLQRVDVPSTSFEDIDNAANGAEKLLVLHGKLKKTDSEVVENPDSNN